jgi:hypothetical protein
MAAVAQPKHVIADVDLDGFPDVLVGIAEAEVGSVLIGTGVNSDAGVNGNVVINERSFDVEDVERVWAEVLLPGQADQPVEAEVTSGLVRLAWATESDADFLRRVTQAARGSDPTALEAKYFAEDQDPKKREKLLDLLLKDPALAKKLGDDWKQKMLEPPATAARAFRTHVELAQPVRTTVMLRSVRTRLAIQQPLPDRFEKLVGELFDANKTDEQVLEAVTLAAVGRLPTAEEKRATLAVIATAQDRKAAWVGLAKALAAPAEGKKDAPPPPAK